MARNSSEMARRSPEHGYIKNIDWISNKTYTIMKYIFKIACTKTQHSWDLVAHPVTQVIGEQALVDILDLSEVA